MDKLAALVPEFYYDLIGRFVPGAIATALFAATALAKFPTRAATSEFLLTCLGIGVAYAAGLLLDVASGLTIGLLNRAFRRALGRVPLMRARPARSLDGLDPWEFMRGGASPRASAVVGKLLAERTCLRSLTLLWALIWLTNTPPASAFGDLGHATVVACLLVAQYRWEYLARVTALTWRRAMGGAAPE